MKKILAIFLCIAMICCFLPLYSALAADSTQLRFGSDGNFKILVLADCQDDKTPDSDMMEAMRQYLDLTKPDLVVFTGDNVVEDKLSEFTQGLTSLLQPVAERNIPYAFTFGNHDDEYGVSKDQQFEVYKTIGNCLTTDPVPSLTGLGTCNIPILHSNNNKMAFNLWMVDSNTYDKTNGGYDNVHSDQLSWLASKQKEITAQEGGVVNSLVFQHIIVPEVTQCLVQSSSGSWTYDGVKYKLQFNEKGSGSINEHPCPPTKNSGEYAAVSAMGGVLGIVTGHDHINDFIAKPGDVDLIQVGGMSYNSYGSEGVRGATLITLNENNTGTYQLQRYLNKTLFEGGYGNYLIETVYSQIVSGLTYISDITVANHESDGATARDTLTNAGYTVIDFDLNKGAGGHYIYIGYKTTTDVSRAITSLRVAIDANSGGNVATRNYHGTEYSLASNIDLNKGISKSDYIYLFYTRDPKAGAPITSLAVTEESSKSGYTVMGSFTGGTAADLNKNAKGAYIYLHMRSAAPVLNATEFLTAYENAVNATLTGKAPERVSALNAAVSDALTLYNSLSTTYRTTSSQSVINSKTAALKTALANLDLPHEHVPGAEATCSSAQYCTLCNEMIAPAKEHKYVLIVSSASTCKYTGFNRYACSECGGIKTENLPLAAHTQQTIPAVVATDCKTEGFSAGVKCSVCDLVITAPVSVGNGPHIPETVKGYTSTCVTPGKTDGEKCSVCKTILTARSDLPLAEHTPGETVRENYIPATCLDNGSFDNVVYCTVCDAELSRDHQVIYAASTPHAEVEIPAVVATSCLTEGFTAGTKCSVCDAVLTAPVSTGFGAHNEVVVKGYAETCTSKGKTDGAKCSLCDKVLTAQSDIDMLDHTPGVTVENNVTSTCTVKGSYDKVVYCTVCETELSRNTVESALAEHTSTVIPAIEAKDCKTEGFTAGAKCSVCDAVLTAPVSTGFGAHNEVVVKGYAETCTSKGKTDGAKCSLCDKVLKEQSDIDMLDHTPGAVTVENIVTSTCTEKGYYDEAVYCTVCETELSRKTVESALAEHTSTVIPAIEAKDCKTEGFTAGAECSVCHIVLSAPVSTGFGSHNEVVVKGYAETCTTMGKTDGTKCSVCDKVLTAQRDIPVAAHTEGSVVKENEKAPTCIAKGSYDNVVYCTVCNTELSREKVETALAEHISGNAVNENVVAGTCSVKGSCEKVVYCTVCNKELSRVKEATTYGDHVKANPINENEIPATCTQKGQIEEAVYCSVCKTELSRNIRYKDATGHKDADIDGYCDECGADMSISCGHICHEGGFLGFIWKIINLFNKLFKINQQCSCGKTHW